MEKYCFILGRLPLISLAEIFNRLSAQSINYHIVDLTSQALIIETETILDPMGWLQSLGGCVKIGKITAAFDSQQELIQSLNAPGWLAEFIGRTPQKIIFGFSVYGDLARNLRNGLNGVGLRLKKDWQSSGQKCRFIVAKEDALTSVQVVKNKLLTNGAEILIISGLSKIYFGKTLAVQDFEDYSYRDFGRPGRDSLSGMLPPKLAQIMINLAHADKTQHLLDPFCGSGTILQEAMLMGLTNLTGSDISDKAIADTKTNLDWLTKQLPNITNQTKVFKADVSSLDSILPPNSVDVIATEPYLGPTISKSISVANMQKIVQELETLYLAAFKTLENIIKPNSRLVFIFPLFKTTSGIFSLKILEQLEQRGFQRLNPFPENVSLFAKIGPTARGSLIYSRPDQKVEREIFIFQYKKLDRDESRSI